MRIQIVILGFKGLNDPVHLFWRLHRQASQHSKCRAPHMDHMHAAVHSSVTYGCQLVNNYAKMHNLLGDVTRRH